MEIEGCTLVAIDTGAGYQLEVESPERKTLGILAWPASWPDRVSPDFLRSAGFIIKPA